MAASSTVIVKLIRSQSARSARRSACAPSTKTKDFWGKVGGVCRTRLGVQPALVLRCARNQLLERRGRAPRVRHRHPRPEGHGLAGQHRRCQRRDVRDLMLTCVERRFNALRAPHPVHWLADNGSAYAARETLEFAVALSPVPCFKPVRSPESNGVSEAFVRTLKRDYARLQPQPDALTVLQQLPNWIDDYNNHHPHSGLPHALTSSVHRAQLQPASCPV